MDSMIDAVQKMKRQQTAVWQRLNSVTLVENSKQTIKRLENLEEHVQKLDTQCDTNSIKLADINLLVHSLLEMVNKIAVAVENLQNNRTLETNSDTANKRDNQTNNHASNTPLQNIKISPTKGFISDSKDNDEKRRDFKLDQRIHNKDSSHTINPDKYKTMWPYKTDLSIDVYNVSLCTEVSQRSHKDDSDFIPGSEEPFHRTSNNGKFVCNEEENLTDKNISFQTTDNKQLSTSNINIQKSIHRCTKDKSGYKSTRSNLQSDNRLSFHNSLESFEGNVFSSPTFRVPVELSLEPNISKTETKYTGISLKSDSHEEDAADYMQFITESQEDLHRLKHRADDSIRIQLNEKANKPIKDKCMHAIKSSDVALSDANIPQTNHRCTKNDFGFKTTRSEMKYDNRVRYHSSSECFEGCEISSSKIEIPMENIPVPNIEQQPFMDDARSKVTSCETWESRPQTQTDLHEDSGLESYGFDEMKPPRTITDWLQLLKQILTFNAYKHSSSIIRRGGGRHITLVLDISERMKGPKFETMKSAAVQYIEGIRQVAMLGMADNIGLAVFGGQSRLILETTNDYKSILEHIDKLQPNGNAPIIGGLLMGLAGVLSGPVGRIGDNALQGHMIIFTDETSGLVFPELEMNVGVTCLFTIGNFRGRPETDSIQQYISSTQTKVYYVPVGDRKNNPILEESVRQTHGKVIQTSEMHRLVRMTQVIGLASQIASEIRYCPHEQTREVIKRKIRMGSSHDDSHDDCLDMVMDFLNPLNMENGQGKFVELSARTLQLGDRVRRGPDWSFGDQDRNLPGTVIGQDEEGIIWVEWDHGQENVYAYDEQRHIYKIMKVSEPRILVDEMIAVGCKVVRGHDWKFGDTNGGPDSIGTVLDVRREGKVVVRWDCKRTGLYKMGHKGRFEIRLKDGNAQTSRQARERIPGRRHARRRSMSDEEDEFVPDVPTTSTKHASDYVIPIYSDSTVSAIWEYQDCSDWKKYPDEINVKIERAYQRKQRKTIIEIDRTTYEVHFSKMEQENPQNKSKVTVRRRD
ncbi:uncharacterized protein LOC134716573 [Mytilus trossulus]|uniref:uncharacterized protein LOC134716573 n=1 Tax=Mytilus trossulus TaxID=6551 RepID=UPI003007696B